MARIGKSNSRILASARYRITAPAWVTRYTQRNQAEQPAPST
jgi:hypothetical protein